MRNLTKNLLTTICLMGSSQAVWSQVLTSQAMTTALVSQGESFNSAKSLKTLTAEELFLRGKNQLKNPKLMPWKENHFGEEMDLSMRRPVVNLAHTVFSEKYGQEGKTLIANFYHDGKLWIARIPNQGVKNVYFLLTHFPPEFIAAHSLLRFEMKNESPLELIAPMVTEEQVDKGITLSDLPSELVGEQYKIYNLALSAEAQWSKEDPKKAYNLFRGQLNAFLQIVRLVSIESRFEEFFKNGNKISQYVVKNNIDPNKVLAEGIARSEKDGLQHQYNTMVYNCTTIAFDIYQDASGMKDRRVGFIRSFIEKRIPVLAPNKLKQFGGVAVSPLYSDDSLINESTYAYQKVIPGPQAELCGNGISKAHCKNLNTAVEMIEKGIQTSEVKQTENYNFEGQ